MGEIRYAAVTGDLVASRTVDNEFRAKVQKETIKVLGELNNDKVLASAMARPAVLTAGDEIQGLFKAPSQLVRFVQTIKDRLYGSGGPNQDIVFGAGWGSLSTGLLPEASSVEQLDGTCFHLARQSLTLARKKKTWTVFRGFESDRDRTLNSLFELMGAIRAGWTIKQSWYTVVMREKGKRSDVAKQVERSASVITESLQSAHYDAIIRGEETARLILQQFDPAPNREESDSI